MTTTWTVTLKTGAAQWSTITVDATNHAAAADHARGMLGDFPVTNIV